LSHAPPSEAPVQWVAADAKLSAGHAPEVPVQVSATSHWPAEARQVKPAAWYWSTQVLPVPEQWSVASHAPPLEVPVQTVAAVANPSVGQSLLVPLQLSATSHCPADARHCVPAPSFASFGQAFAVPSHASTASQTPAAARHCVPADFTASAGHAALEPVQVSATSQVSVAARQTVPALPAGCVQATPVPSQISRVQTLPSSVQAVPADFLVSDGQVALLPVQVSATSHSSAAARQTAPALPVAC